MIEEIAVIIFILSSFVLGMFVMNILWEQKMDEMMQRLKKYEAKNFKFKKR